LFAKDEANIDAMIASQQREEPMKLDLNIEDDAAGFLGILMEQ
jgi:hypothetical protein